ncbi:hypothetical protein CDD81_1135 [Ophiocordyceps australis]|uniref:RNA exonuclease 4 n=1 Tax=Ophiocordyceps australis TaxID=1399860 RepID=A0A2C5XFL0_9HYPO|nr:hypothetical protein CDD81_1135 [Ophiocordyceps australis]
MGGVHSAEEKPGPRPSISLWAEDNDISAEDLAEAYGLGLGSDSLATASKEDKTNHGLIEGHQIGKFVAIDCEMVGVGPGGYESALARVSLVDFHGKQIYDSYVKPQEKVTDWRTAVSGISPAEMKFARDFSEVQEQVCAIMQHRVLVGHDLAHDLEALKLSHPAQDIRDTVMHPGFRKYADGRKPSLRVLARNILGVEIQSGAHSSIEDARVTMLIFRKNKPEFDVSHAFRYGARPSHSKPRVENKKRRK